MINENAFKKNYAKKFYTCSHPKIIMLKKIYTCSHPKNKGSKP